MIKEIIKMKLTITPAAQVTLKPYFEAPNTALLLDYDDGDGYKAEGPVTCTLNQEFRIIVVRADSDYHEYNKKITTCLGDFYYKDYSKVFMDDEMIIDKKPDSQLTLKGTHHGPLAPTLNVIDLRNYEEENKNN